MKQKFYPIFTGRVARNIYMWVGMLYVVLSMNYNNEALFHYGVIQSSLYWPLMIVTTLLQATLIYTNNLLLVPQLLNKKRRLAYVGAVLLLTTLISIAYTVGLKIAKPYLNVDHMQQIGFVTSPLSDSWSFTSLLSDMQTYLFGNLLWVFIFTMAWYMNDYSRQKQLAEDARREQIITELAFLKNQLNPHFLFNTLNNLYALALKKTDTAPDAILKLSTILRYLLYESNIPLVPFEKEEEIMRAYIDLELLRMKDQDKLKVEIKADSNQSIPPLLWLPVLENVFKYGTRIISDESIVAYSVTLQQDQLTIYSKNTLRPSRNSEPAKGIGLQNLRKRLALLYPGKYKLQSHAVQNEYITELNIDLS